MKTVVGVLIAAVVGLHCSAPVEELDGPGQGLAAPEVVASRPPAASEPRGPAGDNALPEQATGTSLAALVHKGAMPHVTSTTHDESGATYTTGTFVGAVDIGGTVIESRGDKDVFLVKLDRTGAFQWVRAIGSASVEGAPRVTHDEQGVTVIGMTKGEMDCGAGPLPTWDSETFFLCIFGGADGTSLAGGVFPTGSP